MIKFFRKIRQRLLTENKFSKYLLYAIGEIILVVIGILIALSINNWNENRIIAIQLNNIYLEVQENLKTDLINLSNYITHYEKLENNLDEILANHYPQSFIDSINKNNYSECMPCKSNISYYEVFQPQLKGFELLKNFEKTGDLGVIDLSQEIIQFYTKLIPRLIMNVDLVGTEALNNLKYYEQFSWYEDFVYKRYNPGGVLFFLTNQTYRNKVVTFSNLAVQNYLQNQKEYREEASYIINKIEEIQKQK